jgi:hypothetical protein
MATAHLASSRNLVIALSLALRKELVTYQRIHALRKPRWVALFQPNRLVQNVLHVPSEQESLPTSFTNPRYPVRVPRKRE